MGKSEFGSFTGRAEPAMMLLDHAGVKYEMKRYDMNEGQKPFAVYLPKSQFPAMACPVLTDGDLSVSQTPAIMAYLGKRLGYEPEGAEKQANCLQMALNAADIWSEGYGARSGEDVGKDFLENRLPIWLGVLEGSLAKSKGPYLFGEKLTYADFEMLNTFNVLEYCYGEAAGKTYTAGVRAWLAGMRQLPAVKAFFSTGAGREPVLYPGVAAAGRGKL